MRLIFLLLALVAAATAVPKLLVKPGNVDTLKKQRDMILLLDHIFEDIKDTELKKFCYEYELKENFLNYRDQGVVKYVMYATKMGYIQPKHAPFSVSISKLRKEVAVLTRLFLCAKDYTTFIKTAAWARCHWNEAQFVKAFVSALFQRPDTRDIVVLPPAYEVFPNYFFDARVINKAQYLLSKCGEKTGMKDVIEIPVDYTGWLPQGEKSLAYFTEDIGLNSYYSLFRLARWMIPYTTHGTDDTNVHNYECDRCEIGRGAQYYYVHQQLLARYNLERMSNNLPPITEVDFDRVYTPFRSHLKYPNGMEIPGRDFDVNLLANKKELVKLIWKFEQRLISMIEKNGILTNLGSMLPLYDRKGLDIIGNLIEATGRSINPRYYGFFDGIARELLGGGYDTKQFFEPYPSVLEIDTTALRDPIFYKLFKRIIYNIFKPYQDALPAYKDEDLLLHGVTIEDVKFDRLVTYCDKFKVDIDSATMMGCDKEKKNFKIEAVVDRLNHKPFEWEVIVRSDKFVKGAVVRLYMGPKFNYDGTYMNIKDHRMKFVELDQFVWDLKVGKTIIKRKSIDAPMRSADFMTKKELLRGVEDALNSHQPFYAEKIPQISGFPERLTLPKGKFEGLPIQMVVIVSSPTAKTMTYGPVIPLKYQTYQNMDFGDFVGEFTKDTFHQTRFGSHEMLGDYTTGSGEWGMGVDRNFRQTHSGERVDVGDIRDRKYGYFGRHYGDIRYGMKRDKRSYMDTTKMRDTWDTETHKLDTDEMMFGKTDYMNDYYKDKQVFEMIGGCISLDGRPLGYPFDRPLTDKALFVPNFKVVDVMIYYEGGKCRV